MDSKLNSLKKGCRPRQVGSIRGRVVIRSHFCSPLFYFLFKKEKDAIFFVWGGLNQNKYRLTL